jgi:SAM-dependent methyltransferase
VTFDELKQRMAVAWGAADWQLVATWLAPMHERLVRSLAPRPGERWLDVAAGTGATALLAARSGADVTAQDLAPGMIERAQGLAERERLELAFDVGDAEALPYPEASFDVVASSVGAILTPDHRRLAGELARVCRPGGRLGLTAWRPEVGYFAVMREFQPPPEPGAGNRENWGREEYVEELLGDHFELAFEEGDNPFVGESGEELWRRQLAGAGTVQALYRSFDPQRRKELEETVIAYFEAHRVGGEVRASAPYLLVLGRRR